MGVSRRTLISQFGNIAPGALTVPVTGGRAAFFRCFIVWQVAKIQINFDNLGLVWIWPNFWKLKINSTDQGAAQVYFTSDNLEFFVGEKISQTFWLSVFECEK